MNAELHHRVLFALGRVVATPGALALLDRAYSSGIEYLLRHVTGDFGVVSDEEAAGNRHAIRAGQRIVSVYDVAGGRLRIITEADRSATTFLLPDEY